MCRKRHRSGSCVPAGEGIVPPVGSAGKSSAGRCRGSFPSHPSLAPAAVYFPCCLPACQTAARQRLPSSSSGYLSCQSNPPPHLYFPLEPATPPFPPLSVFPLPSFLPLPHASPRVSPRFLLPSFLSLFFCFSLITGESVNCSLMKQLW